MFNISLAMNLAPVAVNGSMTYTALYDMVRKCGLRHVVVVNHNNQVSERLGTKSMPLVSKRNYQLHLCFVSIIMPFVHTFK